jgi:hypothetical protein
VSPHHNLAVPLLHSIFTCPAVWNHRPQPPSRTLVRHYGPHISAWLSLLTVKPATPASDIYGPHHFWARGPVICGRHRHGQMAVPFQSNGPNNHMKAPLVSVQRGRGIPGGDWDPHGIRLYYTHPLAWAPQQNTKALFSSPILPKFHYAKRKFPVTSKCRQMHGVLNVDEIKN